MSSTIKLIFFFSILISISLQADALQIDTDTLQTNAEWVVVLENPRPERLQGWQRDEYTSGGSYSGALDLKRAGRRIANLHDLVIKAEWFIESLNVYCLIASFNQSEQKTLDSLRKSKSVKWVQASNNFESTKTSKQDKDIGALFNPPELRLPKSVNGAGAVVALIDSAVDVNHPDIKQGVIENIDFVNRKNVSLGGEPHGTAIASIIVAGPESDMGIIGIAPGAKLKAYRGCWETDDDIVANGANCNTLTLARALDAVAKSDADILNLSLSGPKDRLLDELIVEILSQGTKVVAAFDPNRPAESRFPSVSSMIVKSDSLNQKNDNTISAPGSKVVAAPGKRADFIQGHSVAAAYASGVLALCVQIEEKLQREICTPKMLEQLLGNSTNDLQDLITVLEHELR